MDPEPFPRRTRSPLLLHHHIWGFLRGSAPRTHFILSLNHTPLAPGVSVPAADSGLAWRRSQVTLSTRYGASGREDMVSRAQQERETLLSTSGRTRCVVKGLRRTASQEKLAQDEWKSTKDRIREKQERLMRQRELE